MIFVGSSPLPMTFVVSAAGAYADCAMLAWLRNRRSQRRRRRKRHARYRRSNPGVRPRYAIRDGSRR